MEWLAVLVAAAVLALLVRVGWVCFRRIEQSWAAPAAPAAARPAAARQPPPGPVRHVESAQALHDATGMYLEWCLAEQEDAAARPQRALPAVIEATYRPR